VGNFPKRHTVTPELDGRSQNKYINEAEIDHGSKMCAMNKYLLKSVIYAFENSRKYSRVCLSENTLPPNPNIVRASVYYYYYYYKYNTRFDA